jgi:hypothetical protein
MRVQARQRLRHFRDGVPILHAQLIEDIRQVEFHGSLTDVEPARDLLVGKLPYEEEDNRPLPWSEPRRLGGPIGMGG